MEKYSLILYDPVEHSAPFEQGSGVIFQGILTVSKQVISGARLVTSIKSTNGQELIMPPSSGNDNLLMADTLKPTGGDPSGINFRLPLKSQKYLRQHFNDTNTYINLWDNYDGIMFETLSRQYRINYSIALYDATTWYVVVFLFIIFVVFILFLKNGPSLRDYRPGL